MQKLKRGDLISLEDYAEQRHDYRRRVRQHKQHRRIHLGPHATLYFEDRLTIQYQIQEMLRIERIFEKDGIEEELAAYNPLIPDGHNLKATFMLEYEDPGHRERALAELLGIESALWMQVEGFERIYAIADEDLDRASDEKTSAVHFLRFEFSEAMITALRDAAAALAVGSDHEGYRQHLDALAPEIRQSLLYDFD